jgi:hypothetical protein
MIAFRRGRPAMANNATCHRVIVFDSYFVIYVICGFPDILTTPGDE